MKITNKTLMINFETEVKLGNNDAIELTLVHHAFISESKDGGINVDLDLGIDVIDIKFLGVEIEIGFTQFKKQLLAFGIDVDSLIDEKEQELANSGLEDKLKIMFKNQI